MKIKGAIFDLDGTLLDSMWVWNKVDEDFLGVRGYEVPPDYQQEIAAMGFEETARYTIERFRLDEKPEDIILEWNNMAERTYREEVCIKPYVRETLEMFKSRGVRLGVATASNETLYKECLKRNGIYDYFESFTETREVERGKGFPDIYILAAEKIGCRPEECVVFEDIHKGILAAKSGGFYTVGVYDEKSDYSWIDMKRDAYCAVRGFQEVFEGEVWKTAFGNSVGMNLDGI